MGPACTRRRRLRRTCWLSAPLSLALLSAGAAAAPFAAGTEADPATGELASAPAQALEPLRAEGIQWTLAPWRRSGSLALDLRALRLEDGRRTQQGLFIGDVDLASHIWQPWFVQLRLGVGGVASRSSGDAQTPGGDNGTLTGRAAVSVFPASRFPFEARADVSDSRSSGLSLGGDYRTRRLSLSQGWRPESGNANLHLQVDRSDISDSLSRDTLSVLNATGQRQSGPHQFDLSLSHSDNHRSDSNEHTRLSSVAGRHGYQPSPAMNVETLANWNELRLRAAALDIGSDVRQISTLATWRLGGVRPATGRQAPLLAASARWVDARTQGAGGDATAQAVNATLGLSQELDEAWRVSISGHANRLSASNGTGGDSAGAQAAANWSPPARPWGAWRYGPSVGVNAAASRDSESQERRLLGAQASHGVSRDMPLGEGQTLALSFSQSGAVLRESATPQAQRALAHGASLTWQRVERSGSQSFGGLSATDSRSAGRTDGRFQLFNVQLSQRIQLSRWSSWSANLTLQATRNQSSELDVFTGERRELGAGWMRYYNGTVSYENQRAFGVPRLRGTVLLGVNSQPLERRALGDIDAPRERISESLEARLDHTIGQLDTRLSARVARVDGRVLAAVQARAQRRF